MCSYFAIFVMVQVWLQVVLHTLHDNFDTCYFWSPLWCWFSRSVHICQRYWTSTVRGLLTELERTTRNRMICNDYSCVHCRSASWHFERINRTRNLTFDVQLTTVAIERYKELAAQLLLYIVLRSTVVVLASTSQCTKVMGIFGSINNSSKTVIGVQIMVTLF